MRLCCKSRSFFCNNKKLLCKLRDMQVARFCWSHFRALINACYLVLSRSESGSEEKVEGEAYLYMFMTIPGVQKPHWLALCSATLLWMAWNPYLRLKTRKNIVQQLTSERASILCEHDLILLRSKQVASANCSNPVYRLTFQCLQLWSHHSHLQHTMEKDTKWKKKHVTLRNLKHIRVVHVVSYASFFYHFQFFYSH